MAYLLFIDESGHDLNDSPYEVIAGVAVEDRDLWNLIREVQNLEIKHFGKRYSQGKRELKAKAILKRKTFRLAQQLPDILLEERRSLACKCLECGSNANQKELTATPLPRRHDRMGAFAHLPPRRKGAVASRRHHLVPARRHAPRRRPP